MIRKVIVKIKTDINLAADPVRAKNLVWFFKTGPGQYGEGDKFLGLTVPVCRKIVNQYKDLPLSEVSTLLESDYHEVRLIALLLLVSQFPKNPDQIYNFYLKNTKHINNWDLVDLSAPKIVGAHLIDKPRDILYSLAVSPSLWERRISIISCLYFIKYKQHQDALKISKLLLPDKHDLIHKAVGWILREVGKNSGVDILTDFLKSNYKQLPRTTLRYAIERFPETQRQKFLKGEL